MTIAALIVVTYFHGIEDVPLWLLFWAWCVDCLLLGTIMLKPYKGMTP